MSMRLLSVAALAIGSMIVGQAQADQYSGAYFGGSMGQAKLKLEETDFNETDSAFKFFGGYAFSDVVALEAAYIDGGTPTLDIAGGGSVAGSLTGVNASVLLRARKGSAFAFFLKLGFARYEVEAEGSVNGVPVIEGTETNEDVSAGIGASYLFAQKYMLRIEYESLRVDDADFSIATLGLGYKF